MEPCKLEIVRSAADDGLRWTIRAVHGRDLPQGRTRKIFQLQTRRASYGDRFVSRRSGTDHQAIRSKLMCQKDESSSEAENIFKQNPSRYKQQCYKNLLDHTLNGENKKLLQLTSSSSHQTSSSVSTNGSSSRDLGDQAALPDSWPCAPRKRPLAGQEAIIFDLPGYYDHMHSDILDWGSKDMIVAALGSEIFMWHSPSNHVEKLMSFSRDIILVSKWDPQGSLIAVGTIIGNLYIVDSITKKIITTINISQCPNFFYQTGSVTTIAWSPLGKQIAFGTSLGSLFIRDCNHPDICQLGGNCIASKSGNSKLQAHSSVILNTSFSPDGRYIVSCGKEGVVRIWMLPDLRAYFQIIFANPARAIAWHPWRSSQMALGGGLGAVRGFGDGSISVWDVGRQRNLAHMLPEAACAVDALAWSRLTAEMVVSYWVDDVWLGHASSPSPDVPGGHSRLLVLSALGHATDELKAFQGRTRALLFSPDGTRIASASSGENLFIWNFLGEDGPLLRMYRRKIKRQKFVFSEGINEFNNFGYTIR